MMVTSASANAERSRAIGFSALSFAEAGARDPSFPRYATSAWRT